MIDSVSIRAIIRMGPQVAARPESIHTFGVCPNAASGKRNKTNVEAQVISEPPEER